MSVMVYKKGGGHVLHGLECDYKVVDEEDVKTAIKDGWFMTTGEAHAKNKRKPKAKTEE